MNIDKQCRAYSVPKIIKLPTVEHPVETEFLIPEYCPDIIKILKCDMNTYVISKRIFNNILEIECYAEITVIFCGIDNQLSSVITKYNFTKSFENKYFNDDNVTINLQKNHLNCRQTASRRIDIKGSINIDVCIDSFDVQEVICNIEREDVQLLKNSNKITSHISTIEKKIIIEDELWIGSDKPDVNYIMRQSAIPIINEYKLIGEKIIVKGILKTEILYCSVDNGSVVFSEAIPFSQIIELDIKEKDFSIIVDSTISSLNIKPILSNNTDAGFSISVVINIIVKLECELDIQMIEDCYSTKINTDVTIENAVFNKKINCFNEKIITKKTLSFNENKINRIIDLWFNDYTLLTKHIEDKYSYECNVVGTLIYINENNMYDTLGVKLEFNFDKALENNANELFDISNIKIINCSYTILNDSQIEIQVEISLSSTLYERIKFSFVKDIIESDKTVSSDDSIIIYFCEKEETIWNIAKEFGASVKLLKEQNNLTADTVESQSVLVISKM